MEKRDYQRLSVAVLLVLLCGLLAACGQSFHPGAQAEHQVPELFWAGLAHTQECFLLTDSNPWVGIW